MGVAQERNEEYKGYVKNNMKDTNIKIQEPNKSQMTISKIQTKCCLEVVWDLDIGFWCLFVSCTLYLGYFLSFTNFSIS